ncbi:MAG TPA: cytochrome c biogenesis protein CcsA [Verrucomicrobiae bacterium]|jgi:ABC-type uncharacterized transport system permease subunit
MLTDRQFFELAVFVYGVSLLYSVFLLRQGLRRDTWVNYFVLLAGFGAHTVAVLQRGVEQHRCPIGNLYEVTSFIIWTIAGAYLVMGLWGRVRSFGAFVAPVVFGVGVFALLVPPDSAANYRGGLVSAHVALIALAYGAFGLGSIAAAMYLVQDRNLKLHKLRAALSFLPPIQRLEAIMSGLLSAGFALLTAGLAFAPMLAKQQDVVALLRGDPKIMWSALVWLIYLALVVLRWGFRQHGKRLAWGAVASFTFVMLTFWGFNLLSPIHNP